jgi:NADH-quinone oxidoreductase subunit M
VNGFPWLSTIVLLPLAGTGALFLVPPGRDGAMRRIALGTTLVHLAFAIGLFLSFEPSTFAMQFTESYSWIPQFGISYALGVDGLSLLLVMLTSLLMVTAVLASWTAVREKVRAYMACMLLLETAMVGVFLATDLFAFYVFWEAMLVPMYFLIGIWGGQRRVYAAVKFFLFTMAGSVLMLVAIITLVVIQYRTSGAFTFDLASLTGLPIPVGTQKWLFAAFALAFAIKVPMFPLHTWLPDAHVEAPTAGSVILAGVLLKMGTYGFLRFCLPLFPQAAAAAVPLISTLAVIGIIYGALVALVQTDVKRLVAYSSVSHLGFVMLGLFALNHQGISGGLLQMVNHGLSTGALFAIVGILYERRHTREISAFGGISTPMPWFALLFMVVTLSSIGLPGLNGFVGEFLVLVGAFRAHPVFAGAAALGVVLAAYYMLWMYQRVMYGKVTLPENRSLPDLSFREAMVLLPLVLFIVWIGVYPKTFLGRVEASVDHLVATVREASTIQPPGEARLRIAFAREGTVRAVTDGSGAREAGGDAP